MRGDPLKAAIAVVAATLLAGCGADVLNDELDISGSWSLVLADSDPAALLNLEQDLSGSYEHVILRAGGTTETYLVELAHTPGGWYEVTWRWSDEAGAEQRLIGVGVAFGEGYFAVAEPGESCPLYIFTVGSGALGGRLFLYGDTEGVATTLTGEGRTAPEAPQIPPLGSSLILNALGVDGTGMPYLARYDLVPRGLSVQVSQHIAPGGPGEETLFGTGVRVGEYLVLNTAGFLTVFRQRGEDWFGMWVDLKAGGLASEYLTPDDAKLDVMPFFVGNDFEMVYADDGFFIARWTADGELYESPALAFGEGYLALSIPDPQEPWLGVFAVGEGAMGGRWLTWGSSTILEVDMVSGSARPPEPPELQPLPREGTFSCRGTNVEGDSYEGVYELQSVGGVVACRQTVTPTEGETEIYEGLGAVVGGYLVLATGPFLAVYEPSGDGWNGLWADPYDKKLCSETLTFLR